MLPWMPVNKNMQEWIDKLESLERNKISVPFYSPMGIHIVKWIDRGRVSVLKKNGTVIELSGEEWQLYMEGAFCRTEGRTGVPGAGIVGWFVCGLFVAKYQSGDEAWNEG